jgi:hypothetical protein
MRLAESVRLAEGQVEASRAVLARAFADDPLFTYSLADPVERERLMPPLMAAFLAIPQVATLPALSWSLTGAKTSAFPQTP